MQKSDKGNAMVIVNRDTCINKIKVICFNSGKIKKLRILPEKEYNFIVNQEDRKMEMLKPLHNKNAVDKTLYNKL